MSASGECKNWREVELTLTDVAAYWKKGNKPDDQAGRSRLRFSAYSASTKGGRINQLSSSISIFHRSDSPR